MEAVLAAAGGFAGYVMFVLLALRIWRMTAPAVVVVSSAVAAYSVMIIVVAITRPPFLFWPSSGLYWLLALCFLMIFGAIYKSISLRILADLLDRPDRQDGYQAILDRYVQRESFQDRVRILLAARYVIPSANGLALTTKGRRIAAAVGRVQRIFGIERSG